ncbi:TMEM175 family protein [Rhodobacter sp. KR11]|uniref:TMEM175 family protein n=1 Tax=Rhodobacter sp. KR11 TaxID=2974588 RepID=UPI0022218D43|nr:TMEM175 family protein [Rhodobacter sp. KR11]MCW1920130.1 TMEM175 family protein [Rhodobacter sp. KR11]
MTKGRIEAFSDGVIAIIITIMVLELKIPHGHDMSALLPLLPVFLSYALSFVNVGIYWNNHHHMFHAVSHVGGWVLWANLNLLFWLSLLPFATGFMGENDFAPVTVFVYCLDLLLCALSYLLLEVALLTQHGRDSAFARAIAKGVKDKVSFALYLGALVVSTFQPFVALGIVALVAALWIVPDRRFAKAL